MNSLRELSKEIRAAKKTADLGKGNLFVCPSGTLLEGYSYSCQDGVFGCQPNNLDCCNQDGTLPRCPVVMLDPPKSSDKTETIDMCVDEKEACKFIRKLCKESPYEGVCESELSQYCPDL